MTSTLRCRKCSSRLAPGLDADFCGACLLAPAVAWWSSLPGEDAVPTLTTGDAVGPFVLGARLGEGTFGEVFVGSRREAGEPELVAIKILKPGMDTREVLARFASEREILGRLDHPHIVRILEHGTTTTGRPWFAMELIEGETLTAWCDRARCSIEGRLALFETVCRAVQYAHSRGLLHRDLKPGNVLIATEAAGQPQPKLIDFGLARAVEREWSGDTAFTLFGRAVGTPQYMAPEQTAVDSPETDTRTDVYALGVILYELLTGAPPLSSERLRGAGWSEIQRLIRDEVPPAPSTLFSRRNPVVDALADARASTPARLQMALRGELDWIVLRALEKEPDRRYDTAAALADDLARFRRGEAVLARAPSRRASLRRFVRRHRVAVGVSLAFIALLSASAVVATVLALRARTAERLAVQRLEQVQAAQRTAAGAQESARAASEFIMEMLKSPRPGRRGSDVTVVECLDEAEARVESRFAGKPEVQLQVLYIIEETRRRISFGQRGEPLPLRLVRIADTLADPIRRASWRNDAAEQLRQRELLMPAAEIFAGTADVLRGLGHTRTRAYLGALRGLARCVQPRDPHRAAALFAEIQPLVAVYDGPASGNAIGVLTDEAAALYLGGFSAAASERLQRADALLTPQTVPLIHARVAFEIARILEQQGQRDAALARTTSTLMRLRALGSPASRERFTLASFHADLLGSAGRHDAAITFCQEEIGILQKRVPPPALDVLLARERLVRALLAASRGDEALGEARAVLAERERLLGFRDAATMRSVVQVARALTLLQRPAEAEILLRETLARRQADPRDEGRYTSDLLATLADHLLSRGAPADAAALLRERLALRQRLFGPHDPRTAAAESELGDALMAAGQWEEAEKRLVAGCRTLLDLVVPTDYRVADARARLVRLYRARQREPEARTLLLAAMQELRDRYGAEHPAIAPLAALLAGREPATKDSVGAGEGLLPP